MSGKTQPNISVIISLGETDFALESNNKGDFSKIVTLSTGANLIEISAIDKLGNNKTLAKSVYFSEEKL